nr:hypothetical protein [Neisseria shayeganii]
MAVFQIGQVDHGNGNLLAGQGCTGVLRPFVGGSDNDAVAEMAFTGSSEKTVDVCFLNGFFRSMVFALNCMELACLGSGDQINAGIGFTV